jgi:hypothetical protein
MSSEEIGHDRADWIHLALESDQKQALAKTVIKLPFPYKTDNFLAS